MQGVASGPGKITTFKIIFTLQMAPAMFEVILMLLILILIFSPLSSSAWDQMLINSHL